MIDMRAHKSFSSREPVQFTSWTTLLIDKFICCEAFGQFYDSFGGSKCHCRKVTPSDFNGVLLNVLFT